MNLLDSPSKDFDSYLKEELDKSKNLQPDQLYQVKESNVLRESTASVLIDGNQEIDYNLSSSEDDMLMDEEGEDRVEYIKEVKNMVELEGRKEEMLNKNMNKAK